MHSRSESVRYQVQHLTRYHYGSEVLHAHHLLHLVPRPSDFQECLEHVITIQPGIYRRVDSIDAFGNPVARIEFSQPHQQLGVTSEMQIVVHPRPAVSAETTESWEQVRDNFLYRGRWPASGRLDAARFRHESPHVRVKKIFTEYSADCFPAGRPLLSAAEALSSKLHRELKYAPGETSVGTPVTQVLRDLRGVCQDFAHLMIACLRSRGLPARYVSGYLRTVEQDETAAGRLVGHGASHAWVAVWTPPYGWIEFDPTNGCFVGTDHVAVAWGRDFSDVSPLRGVIFGGAEHQLEVGVTVTPLNLAQMAPAPGS